MAQRAVLFITHAEVEMNLQVPVPEWGLSSEGIRRHRAFNDLGPIGSITAIYCSAERKAVEAARILSGARRTPPRVCQALHENDRSVTGYLPPPEFEAVADLFFANPHESVRGWERAADAQARIVSATRRIIARDDMSGDIAIVAHGGVGALLLCHVLDTPITREHDQPGSGSYYAFDFHDWVLRHGWRNISAPG